MKNKLLYLLLFFPLFCFSQSYTETISQEIIDGEEVTVIRTQFVPSTITKRAKKANYKFFSSSKRIDQNQYKDILSNGKILSINSEALASFNSSAPKNFTMEVDLPDDNFTISLELEQSNIFAKGFNVFQASQPGIPINYSGGHHYHGKIKGDKNSMVAISVFREEVVGLIMSDSGNYNLGKLKNSSVDHIIYNDRDVLEDLSLNCLTEDDGVPYRPEELLPQNEVKDMGDCTNIYIELDQSMIIGHGGIMPAVNWTVAMFNQSAIIFNNEMLETNISEIFVWDMPDPYNGPSAGAYRAQFQNNTGAFNGDLGHLLALDNVGGQAAGFSGICNADTDESLCFSGMSGLGFNNVPTYSFNVQIFTHELGHLFGSRHTHACVWNGNGTAIDGCSGFTEGACALPPPTVNGTIMSYCSPNINFNLGFGPQPGNVIRNTILNAACLGADCNIVCNLVVDCSNITDQPLTCRADLPPVDFNLPIIVDSCGAIILSTLTIIPANSGCPGDPLLIPRTYTIQDAAGNMEQCMQTFTVQSNNAPTITCPAGGIIECADDIPPISPSNAAVTNDCGTAVVVVFGPLISGDPDCPGTSYTYTYTTTDHCNRMVSCDQVFTIVNNPPTIVCPPDITVNCDESTAPGAGGASGVLSGTTSGMVSWSTASTGLVGTEISTIAGAPAGAQVTDVNLNIRMDHSWVGDLELDLVSPDGTIVRFLEDPICPTSGNSDNVNVTFDDQAGAFNCSVVTGSGTPNICASDYLNVSGISGTMQPQLNSFTAFNGEMVNGDWMLMINDDASGDAGCLISFDVEVSWQVPGGGTGTGTPTVSASCSLMPTVTFMDASTQTPTGCGQFTYQITRTWMVVDDCNRMTSCVQIINVVDDEGPMITCSPDMTVECESDIVADVSLVVATDNCDIPVVTFVGPTLVSGQAGCNGAVYEVVYTANDACLNTPAVCTQRWRLENDPPTIVCAPGFVVECAADIVVDPVADVTVTTSCMLAFDVQITGPKIIGGDPDCPGTLYRYHYVVRDQCGRQAMCTREFTIQNVGPVMGCPPDRIVECEADIIPETDLVNLTISCDMFSNVTNTPPTLISGSAGCNGSVYEVTYLVRDACNRTASCTQTWTLQNDAPVIEVCAPDRIVDCGFDVQSEIELIQASSSCGLELQMFASNPIPQNNLGDCDNAQYIINYFVIDECGRTAECFQTWTVENDAPRIIPPDPITVACLDELDLSMNNAEIESACGIPIVSTQIVGPIYDENEPLCTGSVVNFLYQAWDACGRHSVEAQIVTINPGAGAGPEFDNVVVGCDDLPAPEINLTTCDIDYDLTFVDEVVESPGSSDDYRVIRTYSGIDECGITFSFEQIIFVKCDGPQTSTSSMCLLTDEGWADEIFVMEDPIFSTINVSNENPLVIGYGTQQVLITDYSCIADILPIEGEPRVFPNNMNSVELSAGNNCNVEGSEAIRKALFENSLLSQLIALNLNFQANPTTAGLDLKGMCVDLDPAIMEELGSNSTIAALFELAEKAIAGYYPGDINLIEESIRNTLEYFVNCPDYPCSEEGINFDFSDNLQKVRTSLELYPNPAIDQLHVFVKDVKDEMTLRIYSSTGEVVYEKTYAVTTFDQLNIDHLPDGIYNIVLLKDNRVERSDKFIKIGK